MGPIGASCADENERGFCDYLLYCDGSESHTQRIRHENISSKPAVIDGTAVIAWLLHNTIDPDQAEIAGR